MGVTDVSMLLCKLPNVAPSASFRRALRCRSCLRHLVSSTGNFNISTLVHVTVLRNMAFVGNSGHFDNEIDFAGTEGMDGMEVDHIKPSCRLQAFKNDVYLFTVKIR